MAVITEFRTVSFVLCVLLVASDTPDVSKLETKMETKSAQKNAEITLPCLSRALDFTSGLLKDMEKNAENPTRKSKNCEDCLSEKIGNPKPLDCAEISMSKEKSQSGLYDIWPRSRISNGVLKVYCDMEDDGGGWTMIQRRGNYDRGQDYFYEDWNSFKKGFGDLMKDFWIGNDNIFALTNQGTNVIKFVLTDWEGNTTYAIYDEFWIDDEDHDYTMHVKGYAGTAGDSFSQHNNAPFSTKDRDNDKDDNACAVTFKGAWWYVKCHTSNLNGNYLKGSHESFADGVNWKAFRGYNYSLKDTFIKIRPKNFKKLSDKSSNPR